MLLKRSLSTSYTARSSRNTVTLSWDLVMSNMECCGVNNYTDFLEARQFVAASREEGGGRKVKKLFILHDLCLPFFLSRYLRHAASSKVITPCSSLLMKTVLCLLPLQTLTCSRFLLYSNPSGHQLPACSLLQLSAIYHGTTYK